MVHKDIANISRMLDEEKKIHLDEVKHDRIGKLFGPSLFTEQAINVNEVLQKYIDVANTIAKEREDSNLALLAQINEGIPKEQDTNMEEDIGRHDEWGLLYPVHFQDVDVTVDIMLFM